MPTPTYTPLATVTLGASASSVTFSSIPATYRDLILVMDTTSTSGFNTWLRFNGDTGSNYSWVFMAGFSGGTFSQSSTQVYLNVGDTYTTRSPNRVQIMDYSATDKHKTTLSRSDNAANVTIANAGRWANTSAITSITALLSSSASFSAGSTFSLYGVIA